MQETLPRKNKKINGNILLGRRRKKYERVENHWKMPSQRIVPFDSLNMVNICPGKTNDGVKVVDTLR
jgi:hypothetical protein